MEYNLSLRPEYNDIYDLDLTVNTEHERYLTIEVDGIIGYDCLELSIEQARKIKDFFNSIEGL